MSTAPLAIGFVTVANLPQGTGRTGRLRTLAGALTGLGHRVVIWNQHGLERSDGQKVSGELSGARFEYVLGTTNRQWGFPSIPMKLRAVGRIRRKIREAVLAGELDLVIFNHLAFYDTFPLTRQANRLGLPTIQCYEDERRELVGNASFSQRVFGLNSWLADHWCSQMADQIWVISSYLRDKYARLSRAPEKLRIVPTIIDCAAWELPEEPEQSPPVLLYSGSFTEQDDTEKLALVLGCLRREKVEFKMRFLGADPQNPRVEKLKNAIKQLQIEDSVQLLGFQPIEIVKREICKANILVNLRSGSLWARSGLSTKLSEYLAAGRTVLTTDSGDNARYVENGKSGLVVSANESPEAIATILRRAIEDPRARRMMGKQARQTALTHFDVRVVQESLRAALAEIAVHGGCKE